MNAQKKGVKDTIYLDEYERQIEKDIALKKCKSNVYYCRVRGYDSLVVYSVYYKYFFGKLEKKEYKHYISVLNNKLKIKTDTNSTLVIHFWKVLANFDTYKRVTDSIKRHNKRIFNVRSMSETAFKNYNRSYRKTQKKCLNKMRKINKITPVYLYSDYYDGKEDVGAFEWKKDDNQLFNKRFFNDGKKFDFLILKPDGNFFLKSNRANYNDFSEKDVFDLLKSNSWDLFHIEWNKRKKKLQETSSVVQVMKSTATPKFKCFE